MCSSILEERVCKLDDFCIIGILVDVSSLSSTVYAQEGNVTATKEPKFLAIHNAQSGSISNINDTAYSLELNDISKKTILFSDRPDRIVTSISTSDFIGNWSADGDSFGVDPPNTVLVVDDSEKHHYDAIVELFNPVYYSSNGILKYVVTPNNDTAIDLPSEFGQSTFIIDEIHCDKVSN